MELRRGRPIVRAHIRVVAVEIQPRFPPVPFQSLIQTLTEDRLQLPFIIPPLLHLDSRVDEPLKLRPHVLFVIFQPHEQLPLRLLEIFKSTKSAKQDEE